MSGRVDPEGGAFVAPLALAPPGSPEALAPLALDPDDRGDAPALPHDHPAWMRDAVSLSQRARALLATMKPVVLRVIDAWEHRVRNAVIGGRTVKVDASGSYRVD
ncbi:MAG: hypothetical protein NVS3B17_01690 [Vulcanimicrobiaceae bacterium]